MMKNYKEYLESYHMMVKKSLPKSDDFFIEIRLRIKPLLLP